MSKPTTPHIALKFLRWFCREDYLDEIEGDLIEIYEAQYQHSPAKAKRRFFWNTLRHFRPEFIKALGIDQNSNTTTMVRHNTVLAFRNFRKYRSSFLINLTGLSSGIVCALLIYLWVTDEMSIDRFHENEGSIYQVMSNIPIPGDTLTSPSTPGLLASTLKEEFPEVQYASSAITPEWFDNDHGVVSYKEQSTKALGQLVEQDYFQIFSWKIIAGNKNELLEDKYAVVISDEVAVMLFGTVASALDKTIEWDKGRTSGSYHVTGVFEKPPSNSTAQFDLLLNYQVFYDIYKKNLDNWGNSNPDTYVLLAKDADINQFSSKISGLKRRKLTAQREGKNIGAIASLFPIAYSDRYLYNNYVNGIQTGGRISYVKLFSLIAVFIITIACINFMNLATARASRRLKEIGIKKAIGANRSSLVVQFLAESTLITMLSVFVGLLTTVLLLPYFNDLTGKQLSLEFTAAFSGALAVLTLLVSLFSGLYPAFYLSRFKPSSILKGSLISSGTKTAISEKFIRKALVVFQFTISIILIMAVIVIYQQINLVQTKHLGYNDDNILAIATTSELEDDPSAFINEIKNISGVQGTTTFGHDFVGDVGGTSGVRWPGMLPDQRIEFGNLEVDFNWFELLEIEISEGRSYTDQFNTELDKIILNETAIKAMGLENPIGTIIRVWGEDREIIGVAKDFHFKSLYEEIKPCMIQLYPNLSNILVKVGPNGVTHTISELEKAHKKHNGGLPLEFTFIDDDYQKLYEAERLVAKLTNYFALIAILISCLGLLALAAFTTEKRQKEIGIRKVLGSSVVNIVKLLSADFAKMVVIAILIALPLSYFFAEEWLNSFAFRVELSWWWFALSGTAALVIAWLTVSLQTFKAANQNPVECLKDE
ncbi:MAG: FtsX-like permease family protein [Bacteroidota bacterium]